MRYLVHLNDEPAVDPHVVGHKFASLARAYRAGFRVPEAVAVRTDAHRFYIENGMWPDGLLDEVCKEARNLAVEKGLSVRSSGTCEDLEGQSFAGQYKTFLDVRSEADLKDKIEGCWAAAGKISSDYFHLCRGEKDRGPLLMGVILQKMVHAIVSGVAFSRNPIYPAREEVVIESTEGLGESLVGGHVTPQRAFVCPEGTIRFDESNAGGSPKRAFLEKRQWHEIAALARKLEKAALGKPQDIEWAICAEGTLWLLQSRPITTIRQAALDAAPGVWTRKIANDLWADRLTTFLGDAMVRNSPRFDFSKVKRFLGIPGSGPSLAVINGFLYVSSQNLEDALKAIPGRFRTADMRSLFPPGFEIEKVPPPSVLKVVSLVIRSLMLSLLDFKANPLLCYRLTVKELKRIENRLNAVKELPKDTSRQALHKLKEAVECMARLQETNQWPYYYATVFTWAMRWLAVDLAGLQHQDFLRIISKGADNVTIKIEGRLRAIADLIRRDGSLASRFLTSPCEDLAGLLPDAVQREVDSFLKEFGVRSRQRTLYVKRWAEAPEEVLGMLALLLSQEEAQPCSSIACRDGHRGPDHFASPLIGLSHASWPVRIFLKLAQPHVRKFLDLREDLRFFLDKILFVIREAIIGLGEKTGLGERSMFLTERELEDLVSGKMDSESAGSLAERRFEEFSKPAVASSFYVDGRPVDELTSPGNLLRGTATSPGRATGRARIVDNPARASLRKGDILVAANTDPGWTPILSLVSAVVAEEGGLLNHLSIVARELGVPAVVGLRGATRKIPEGALITVDGNLGTVRIAGDAEDSTQH